jgi:hypothetical protein
VTAPRLLVGNLLGEDDLARLLHAGDPRRRRERPPSQTVLRTASRLATLLRAFAREGGQGGILAYAQEIGWTYVPRGEVAGCAMGCLRSGFQKK